MMPRNTPAWSLWNETSTLIASTRNSRWHPENLQLSWTMPERGHDVLRCPFTVKLIAHWSASAVADPDNLLMKTSA